MSDGLNTNFNSNAYELYLKHIGQIIYRSDTHMINLIYDTSYDSLINVLLLENLNDSEKRITLAIESCGYCIYDINGGFKSLDNYQYKAVLKPKEMRYLFPIAIGGGNSNEKEVQNSINIKYHIIFE
jgi:hypothetical protein